MDALITLRTAPNQIKIMTMRLTSWSTEPNLECCKELTVMKDLLLFLKTLPQFTTAFLTNLDTPPLIMAAKNSHAGTLTPSKIWSQRSSELRLVRARLLMRWTWHSLGSQTWTTHSTKWPSQGMAHSKLCTTYTKEDTTQSTPADSTTYSQWSWCAHSTMTRTCRSSCKGLSSASANDCVSPRGTGRSPCQMVRGLFEILTRTFYDWLPLSVKLIEVT